MIAGGDRQLYAGSDVEPNKTRAGSAMDACQNSGEKW
jgi:hypothetical protein